MSDSNTGCARPTGAQLGETEPEVNSEDPRTQEGKRMTARVGGKAPDFTAPAYYKGEFTRVQLSDYLGKWTMICFYPGDFTFV